jgi:CcmD family protein
MKKIAKLFLLPVFTSLSSALHAQQEVEMADALRSNGKIYVVVVIILIIFIGLIAYLFSMDRKITRLEKRIGEKKF